MASLQSNKITKILRKLEEFSDVIFIEDCGNNGPVVFLG